MFSKDLLNGKRILVTGGGTGLGKAMSEGFMALGADVVICGRRKGVLDDTARELMDRYPGRKVDAFGVDIRDFNAVDAMVEEVFQTGAPLTGLINNAAGNFISRTEDLTPGGFNAIANIVMHGTFYVTHSVGKRWIARQLPGSVISILATWVRNGGPYVTPSAMSKAAVNVMTMSLAAEWGHYGIRLNSIAPGEIPTEGMNARLSPGQKPGERAAKLNPMGRHGTFADLQNLASFLQSDGSSWINGETIALDGAQGLATGGNFYSVMRDWSDADWQKARDLIRGQNEKDRSQRTN